MGNRAGGLRLPAPPQVLGPHLRRRIEEEKRGRGLVRPFAWPVYRYPTQRGAGAVWYLVWAMSDIRIGEALSAHSLDPKWPTQTRKLRRQNVATSLCVRLHGRCIAGCTLTPKWPIQTRKLRRRNVDVGLCVYHWWYLGLSPNRL